MNATPSTTMDATTTQDERMTDALQNSVNILKQNQYENMPEALSPSGDFLQARRSLLGGLVPPRFKCLTFEQCLENGLVDASIADPLSDYVDLLQQAGRRPVVLYGACGAGKTLLAAAVFQSVGASVCHRKVFDRAVECGTADNVCWMNGTDLVGLLKDPMCQRLAHVATAYLGVLDDLDKHPSGGWSEGLLKLVNLRLCMEAVPTIVTTNLSPVQLVKKYGVAGEAIVDRFMRTNALVIKVPRNPEVLKNAQQYFGRVDAAAPIGGFNR